MYTGCNSDAECQETDPANVCADFSALGGIPSCVRACSVAEDCSQGSAPFDADNYECDDGICLYTGCNSDAECMSLPTPLVCR